MPRVDEAVLAKLADQAFAPNRLIDMVEMGLMEVDDPALRERLRAALNETAAGVIAFVREWRPVGDSNPCYRRERAVS
jgi:hypothetical protein